jgi:uncharacterized Ntn-hydrolase superfamily protein
MRALPAALLAVFALGLLLSPAPADPPRADDGTPLVATFSIVARDPGTGDLGVAVQSKFPNVGGIVPWARAGVGAVATQALANTDYGEKGLALLAMGATAHEAMRILVRDDARAGQRQAGMVDARGRAASWTGDSTFDWAGGRVGGAAPGGKNGLIVGRGYAAQGNILVSDATVRAMAETFERTPGTLAERLLAALAAGQAAGGDRRGMESAALLVVRAGGGYLGASDRYIDLRVYDHAQPIAELERLYALHTLYFFTSRDEDLIPITPEVVRRLEPILLREPLNQTEKWLAAPQGRATAAFLQALENFMYWENYDVRVRNDGKIDRVVLEDILRRRGSTGQ